MNRELTVEEICRNLKPIFGKRIDDIYLKYAMADTREGRDEIVHMLNALYHKNFGELLDRKVLLEPPKAEVMNGEYNLASVSYSGKKLFPFNLREKDWPRHVCITGMSGSGKTTFAFNILNSFIENDKSFLVFDWKKSFRPLLLASSEVMCFTVGNDKVSNLFKMNINQPPKGIDPKEWINVLCDLLTESFSVSFGVHKVLLETLDEAFEEWGVYEGSENYPTWNHIKWYLDKKVEKTKGREAGWLESSLRIVSVLTYGSFGKVCNSKEGSLKVEDLLDKKVIFELNALSSIEKKFFCEFVLTYIYKLKKARQGNLKGKFDHAILVDEAHNVFLKGPTHFTKESVTDTIYREMREYGTSLICLDQHLSKLSDTVKGNSACSIAFQQQLPQDIFDASGLMQLMDRKNYFSMLPVGSAIVKLSERHTEPFLIEVPKSEMLDREVTDKEVRSRAEALVMGIGVEKGSDEKFRKELVGNVPQEIESIPEQKIIADPEIIEVTEKKVVEVKKAIEEPIEKKVKEVEVVEVKIEKNKVEKIIEVKPIIKEIKSVVKEVKVEIKKSPFTQVQSVLYEFVETKLAEGKPIYDIENLMEINLGEGGYTLNDIAVVVDYALKERFMEEDDSVEGVTTLEVRKPYKVATTSFEQSLDKEQEEFMIFLLKNKGKDYGTVSLYNELGLSSRKGNKIKNELMEKNLIEIHEQKNDKGWKKIIQIV